MAVLVDPPTIRATAPDGFHAYQNPETLLCVGVSYFTAL
jgi:hypothetical protein